MEHFHFHFHFQIHFANYKSSFFRSRTGYSGGVSKVSGALTQSPWSLKCHRVRAFAYDALLITARRRITCDSRTCHILASTRRQVALSWLLSSCMGMGLTGPYSTYRRKYLVIATYEAACRNIGRRWPLRHSGRQAAFFYGDWRLRDVAIRYLFAGASGESTMYACVRGSSQGGEFDPSLVRFYARAENNLHNDRCARLAGTIADEFMHFLTIHVFASINGAKYFRIGLQWLACPGLN